MPGNTNKVATEISRTECFELLSDPRRVAILQSLANCDDPVGLTELSQMVAEVIGDAECIDSQQRVKRLQILLYHAHLPRLDAAGVVDFESSDNRVVLTPRGEQLITYLNRIEEPPV